MFPSSVFIIIFNCEWKGPYGVTLKPFSKLLLLIYAEEAKKLLLFFQGEKSQQETLPHSGHSLNFLGNSASD